MLLDNDMNMILPAKLSGVAPNLNSKLLTPSQSSNVSNPGKIFHSNSIGSPSILSKFLYAGEVLYHSNLSSHALFDWGSRVSCQDTLQNPKRRRPLCVED